MRATHLVCKGCGATYPLEALFACSACFGPLEVGFTDLDEQIPRERIEQGPRTLWRYADFLPVAPPPVGLPVGLSPLIKAEPRRQRMGPAAETSPRPVVGRCVRCVRTVSVGR